MQRRSDEKIAEANERAAEANQKASEAELQLARVGISLRKTALATTSNLATSEIFALSMGFRAREDVGEVGKPFLIIEGLKLFAGKRFDAAATCEDISREALLNSLRHALVGAGWIEVGVRQQSSADHASIRGIRIDADGSKDPTLSDAANALASALNSEGVEATANQTPETDPANANVVHILVGPSRATPPTSRRASPSTASSRKLVAVLSSLHLPTSSAGTDGRANHLPPDSYNF